jgi:hypothetical protein
MAKSVIEMRYLQRGLLQYLSLPVWTALRRWSDMIGDSRLWISAKHVICEN